MVERVSLVEIIPLPKWRSNSPTSQRERWVDRRSTLANPFADDFHKEAYRRWLWCVLNHQNPDVAAQYVAIEMEVERKQKWCPPAGAKNVVGTLDILVNELMNGLDIYLVCTRNSPCACCQNVKNYLEYEHDRRKRISSQLQTKR